MHQRKEGGRPRAVWNSARTSSLDPSLAQQLAAAERSRKWRAFLLTAPLLLFLLLTFLGPIGALLTRSVVDTEFASALPMSRVRSGAGMAALYRTRRLSPR